MRSPAPLTAVTRVSTGPLFLAFLSQHNGGSNVSGYEALLQELEEARQGQRRAEKQQRQAEEQ